MHKFIIQTGDPSDDGHGKYDNIHIESNHTKEEIYEAYVKSCELTGLSFDDNNNKLSWNHPEYKDRMIACDYESSYLSKLAENVLKEHGLDVWKEYNMESEDEEFYFDSPQILVQVFMMFVKLSLPTLEYKIITDKTPRFELTLGYGLYH